MVDYEGLERLVRLRDSGALTQDEFEAQKQRILSGGRAPSTRQKSFAIVGLLLAIAVAAILARYAFQDVSGTVSSNGSHANGSRAAAAAPHTFPEPVGDQSQVRPPAAVPAKQLDKPDTGAVEAREVRGMPRRLGECARTTIRSVGTRLEEQDGQPVPGSGSDVLLANGVYGVSYEQEPPVDRSRPGDRVLTCLVGIPRGCPPGDDRGRSYTTTNLRTGESWTLPDASHMCGGA